MFKKVSFTAAAIAALSGVAEAAPVDLDVAGFAKLSQSFNSSGGVKADGLDVGFSTPGSSGATSASFIWTNNEVIDWSYSYDGTNVIFNWGGTVVQRAADVDGRVTGFEGYVRAQSQGNANSIQDQRLEVNFDDIGGVSPPTVVADQSNGFVNFLFDGLTPKTNFNLTGTAIASWTGTFTQNPNSRVAFQVDALVSPIPLPATSWMFLSAVGGAAFLRLRKQKRARA